ncbi:hypothetical protein I306_03779, partial [Cryptococcus gattii EJB2]
IPLPPSPTFSLINLPTISSSAESQENEQIRPSSEKAEPEGNQSPDQHASPAANDLQTLQTSESDGKSPQSPLMLITSAWTIQETCTPLDRSPTLSPIDDEIIVSPVGSQDSKAGLMVDRIDIQEYVGLDGKVQQPGYSRSRSASPEFQMAEMGFSGEKRGNNKSWRRSMANLSEALTRRSSSKSPPTSYDAYITRQRQVADYRQGCSPTVYRTGAQAILEATNGLEEEDEMAEIFFLL